MFKSEVGDAFVVSPSVHALSNNNRASACARLTSVCSSRFGSPPLMSVVEGGQSSRKCIVDNSHRPKEAAKNDNRYDRRIEKKEVNVAEAVDKTAVQEKE
jgi:hypothetical protein